MDSDNEVTWSRRLARERRARKEAEALGERKLRELYAANEKLRVEYNESLRLRGENLDLIQQLTLQKEAAEKANLAKSRFLAVASHDLRQPMHALSLYLGTTTGFALQAPIRSLLTKARQCAHAMDQMFRALLDISRLDAGTTQPQIVVFPIAAIIDHVQVQFEPDARAKRLMLRAARCSALVCSDSAMVERILRNFLANAIRHTESGKILIGCRRRGAWLRVAVYDTGPGIPADQQDSVFEEFNQLPSSEHHRTKGLGLGLAIVQRLAKLLEAPITLVSHPGRGSMFAIDLPLASDNEMQTEICAPNVAEDMELAGAMILIVDDEEFVLDATRSQLEQWGCAVITATCGTEAKERLTGITRVPDVIICDYQLQRGENGAELIAALRTQLNQRIPALIITGDTVPQWILDSQAHDLLLLYKPFERAELGAALSHLIKKRTPMYVV